MFNFTDMTFGIRFEAYGEQWIMLKHLVKGFCLAIKESSNFTTMPSTVYMVQVPERTQPEPTDEEERE